jgi:hypothetical protein
VDAHVDENASGLGRKGDEEACEVSKELVMPDHSSGELRRTGRILLIEAVGLNSVDLPE